MLMPAIHHLLLRTHHQHRILAPDVEGVHNDRTLADTTQTLEAEAKGDEVSNVGIARQEIRHQHRMAHHSYTHHCRVHHLMH